MAVLKKKKSYLLMLSKRPINCHWSWAAEMEEQSMAERLS